MATSLRTPTLSLGWANIDGPGKDNYNKDGKVYTITAYADKGSYEEKELTGLINKFWLENKPNAKAKPSSMGYKPEMVDDEETGRVTYTFSTRTTYASGDKVNIPVLDFKGRNAPLLGKKIGNGSTGVVHGSMGVYNQNEKKYGVSLYLKAVQLLKLVEFDSVQAEEIAVSEGETAYGSDTEYTGTDGETAQHPENAGEGTESKPEL